MILRAVNPLRRVSVNSDLTPSQRVWLILKTTWLLAESRSPRMEQPFWLGSSTLAPSREMRPAKWGPVSRWICVVVELQAVALAATGNNEKGR